MGMIDGILVGNDCILNDVDDKVYIDAAKNSPTVAESLRESAHRILYVVGNSNAMNGAASNVYFFPVTNWWQYTIAGLQIGFGAVTLMCGAICTLTFFRNRKKYKEG